MSSKNIAIAVRGLCKTYHIEHKTSHFTAVEELLHLVRRPFHRPPTEELKVLDDISFDIERGDVVGIIGRNGAGKSTLFKILSRIVEPTAGEARIFGRVGSLIEVGTGFQPELTGRENIYLNGAILGMRRSEIARRFDEIVDFSGVEKFLDTPVKRYSSGMYVRLAFSVAAYLDTDILLVDEVLSVGDAEFQKKSLRKMSDIASTGRTVVFVSHSLATLEALCTKGLVLAGGHLVQQGPLKEALAAYHGSVLSTLQLSGSVDDMAEHLKGKYKYLRSIDLLNDAGESARSVPLGADIKVRFLVEAAEPIHHPHFRVVFQNFIGSTVLTVNSPLTAVAQPFANGLYEITCDIPSLPLAPGDYGVSIHVKSGVTDIVLEASSVELPFSVQDYDKDGDNWVFGGGACVSRAQWQLSPLKASQS